jgi:hypothetical protein
MQFKTLTGATKRVTKPQAYRINWDGPSRSKIQNRVKKILKKAWLAHVVFEEFPVVGTKMTLDFYNANKKIAIEVQGKQHTKYTPFFHGKNKINYISQLRRDHQKREFCEKNSIELFEIHEGDSLSEEFIFSVINKDER